MSYVNQIQDKEQETHDIHDKRLTVGIADVGKVVGVNEDGQLDLLEVSGVEIITLSTLTGSVDATLLAKIQHNPASVIFRYQSHYCTLVGYDAEKYYYDKLNAGHVNVQEHYMISRVRVTIFVSTKSYSIQTSAYEMSAIYHHTVIMNTSNGRKNVHIMSTSSFQIATWSEDTHTLNTPYKGIINIYMDDSLEIPLFSKGSYGNTAISQYYSIIDGTKIDFTAFISDTVEDA